MHKNVALLADMRARCGDDFWLMYDCWMALDVDYATRLATACHEHGLKWIEEAISPDDYWGYAELKRKVPPGMLVTTGEHEATRWGFRMLIDMDCCDIIQPDVGWCGGVTELLKISALSDAHGKMVVPHGSSVYSYHFVITRYNSPYLFGTDRAMMPSDSPTDRLFASFDDTLEMLQDAAGDLPLAEQHALFAGNANRLYRLGLDLSPFDGDSACPPTP